MRTVIVAALIVLSAPAFAGSPQFPPVAEVQAQLHARPGDPLPKQIVWRNHVFQPYFVKATQRSGGFYVVIVRLLN